MSAFVQQALKSPNLFGKVFGSSPKENALLELNNTLASSASVRDVSFDRLDELNRKYNIDLHSKFATELRELYAGFLQFCLKDRQFTDEEVADLWHLKALFGISDSEHEALYATAALETYKMALTDALEDSSLTEMEKAGLEQLSAYLQIPEAVRQSTYEEAARAALQLKSDQLTSDNQLSPTEEAELHALARSLGCSATFDHISTAALQRMRVLWHISNGQLPPLPVGINLQRDESCYLTTDVNWFETRRVTQRVSYGGPSFRMKIAKGFYWNSRSYAVARHSQDVLTKIDAGRVYLTSKRVIFNGSGRNQSIRLQKILDVIPYKNGVELEKDAGKTPFLELDDGQDIQIFTALLIRLIRDAND